MYSPTSCSFPHHRPFSLSCFSISQNHRASHFGCPSLPGNLAICIYCTRVINLKAYPATGVRAGLGLGTRRAGSGSSPLDREGIDDSTDFCLLFSSRLETHCKLAIPENVPAVQRQVWGQGSSCTKPRDSLSRLEPKYPPRSCPDLGRVTGRGSLHTAIPPLPHPLPHPLPSGRPAA